MARYLLGAADEEMGVWKAAAAAQDRSFASWLRGAARLRLERDAGLPAAPLVLPPAAALPSAVVESGWSSRGRVVGRGGGCVADAPSGLRCKLCGEVHR
jgi:hypothetical protein